MSYFYISLAIQLVLVVHAIKTGRNLFWVFIIVFFPLIGALAYLIIEVLPEIGNYRGARRAGRFVTSVVNPNGSIKKASQHLEVADTVQNSIALGTQYLDRSQFAEAREVFSRCRKGVHADDPVILLGLAKAQFGLAEYQDAIRSIEDIRQSNPTGRFPEAHLLYARAQEQLGDVDKARKEYEALCKYYPGPEPKCRLALILKASGDVEEARDLFKGIASESKIAGKHYNRLHKEWVSLARREATS
ncbi:MAG: tetratricopeptide repeat protein [Gammaproteobacteria bacterium]